MAGVTHLSPWVVQLQWVVLRSLEWWMNSLRQQQVALGPFRAKTQTILLQPPAQLSQLIPSPANLGTTQTPPSFKMLKMFRISLPSGHRAQWLQEYRQQSCFVGMHSVTTPWPHRADSAWQSCSALCRYHSTRCSLQFFPFVERIH